MKYIALFRGINVGKSRRVEMKKLRALFESLNYVNVSTYINSGNVIFETNDNLADIRKNIQLRLKKEFEFDIAMIIKTEQEMREIVSAIPLEWKNDSKQRSDVAYLFNEIDSEKVIAELPVKKEYLDIRYTKGAVFWNVERKNYNKSHLNKLVGHKFYQLMTIRNVNTARFLAGVN
jgi:uncharacterized protein (DUF1697 family)